MKSRLVVATSAESEIVNQERSRKGFSLSRTIHRIGGLLASLLMLYLAGTGVTMQILDLHAILTHTPATDPTVLSMNEGMYGPGNFPVIQLTDINAAALPPGFDINQAIGTVLQATHGDQPGPMAWVEVRVVNGIPIGQVMMGTKLEAFNARTGEHVTPVPPTAMPAGARLPPSLRQKIKTWHRFWNRADTPGVYFEVLSGVIMWTLLITGLVMYFRLLRARARQGRSQIFWLTGGGLWRGLHRVVSVAAALFILCIAFSGTWIGFESVVNALRRSGGGGGTPPVAAGRQGQPGQPATVRRRSNPADFIVPLRDAEVREMTATTLASMQQLNPGAAVKAIRLRVYGQMKQGVVVTGGDETGQLVFNADTGQPVTLSDSTYPESGFPFGTQVHENIKHFHSGAMFGIPTRLMSLFAGFSLTFLSISGIVVYLDMWRKRRKGGRNGLVWR